MKKHSTHISLILTLGMLALAACPGQAAPLIDDTFSNGNRTSDPAWYWRTNLTSDRVDSVASNAWTVGNSTGSGNGYVVTYFTPTTIGVEETMTFSFDFSYDIGASTTITNHFRFGLFNSNGSKVSADGGTTDPAFNSDLGYGVYSYLISEEGGTYTLEERTATNDTLWSSSAFPGTLAADPDGSGPTSADTTYTATLTLTRTIDDELIVTSSINGRTLTYTDTSPGNLTFDMISMYAGGANGALTYSNIEVSTAIPEPGTTGLIAGTVGLLCLGLARRKRSHN